jgi:hypothetical protein
MVGAVVLIIVVVVVVVLAAYYEYRPGGPQNPYVVKVGQVIWTQNGAALSTTPGFSVHAGKHAMVGVSEPCASFFGYPETCSSGSVYILTPGFGIASTNAPFSWSSGSSGASGTITVYLTTPSSSYTGNLEIDLH